jgi:hypothetical protein
MMPRGAVSLIGRATLDVNSGETINLYFTFLYAHRLISSFLTSLANASSPTTFVLRSPLELQTFIKLASFSSCCIEAALVG